MIKTGYRGTTIAAVAGMAGVDVDTVYQLIGRKPVLLRELIEHTISGSSGAVVAEERDYVRPSGASPTPPANSTSTPARYATSRRAQVGASARGSGRDGLCGRVGGGHHVSGSNCRRSEKAWGVGPFRRRCSSRLSPSSSAGRSPSGTHHMAVVSPPMGTNHRRR